MPSGDLDGAGVDVCDDVDDGESGEQPDRKTIVEKTQNSRERELNFVCMGRKSCLKKVP